VTLPTRSKFKSKRGPACSICEHENRTLIEAAKCAGASLDTISARYGASRDAIHRHWSNHVSEDAKAQYLADVPLKELAAAAAAEGVSVLGYLAIIRSLLMRQLQTVSLLNDHHATSALAGRLNETLRTIGQLSGQMGDMAARTINISGNVNILNSPVIATLQANLLRALAPFPEARSAVIGALRAMDSHVDDDAASGLPDAKLLELRADEVANAV
jgi:hypothetical protein